MSSNQVSSEFSTKEVAYELQLSESTIKRAFKNKKIKAKKMGKLWFCSYNELMRVKAQGF